MEAACRAFRLLFRPKLAAERPRPRDLQADWFLRELLEGRDPAGSAEKPQMCRDWNEVIEDLRQRRYIRLTGGHSVLTAAGRKYIQDLLYRHGNELPAQEPWRVRVGPIGTGHNLVKDPGIWEELKKTERHVVGLDMEGSVIGMTAHVQEVPRMIVIKAVMDYADPSREHGFRSFAAQAAAEVLIGFLRERGDALRPAAPVGILSPNTWPPPSGADNPATLLNARYQRVPFFKAVRETEISLLEAWCGSKEPTGVRLFVGPGGVGKTRLMIHWTKLLRDRDWDAGFLSEQTSDEDQALLLRVVRPTFVVVDYAESRPGLERFLRQVAFRPAAAQTPLRIALVAREKADCWEALRKHDVEVARLLDGCPPQPLAPVPLQGPLRQEVFDHAFAAFAKARNRPTPAGTVDLEDERFGRMLYLHMAALAAVEGLSPAPDTLLKDILEHEQRF